MITVHSEDLIAAIKRALPHTSTPAANVPVLEDIYFSLRGGQLVLTATDKYTVVETRLEAAYDGNPTSFRANGKRLKEILPVLKVERMTQIVVEDGVPTFGSVTVANAGKGLEYPPVSNLWPEYLDPMSGDLLGLGYAHAKKLGSFTPTRKEKADGTHWVLGQSESTTGKAVVAMFGHSTRFLIMPVRINKVEGLEPSALYDSWRA